MYTSDDFEKIPISSEPTSFKHEFARWLLDEIKVENEYKSTLLKDVKYALDNCKEHTPLQFESKLRCINFCESRRDFLISEFVKLSNNL